MQLLPISYIISKSVHMVQHKSSCHKIMATYITHLILHIHTTKFSMNGNKILKQMFCPLVSFFPALIQQTFKTTMYLCHVAHYSISHFICMKQFHRSWVHLSKSFGYNKTKPTIEQILQKNKSNVHVKHNRTFFQHKGFKFPYQF